MVLVNPVTVQSVVVSKICRHRLVPKTPTPTMAHCLEDEVEDEVDEVDEGNEDDDKPSVTEAMNNNDDNNSETVDCI